MKLSAINVIRATNSNYGKRNTKTEQNEKSFKGYVNGKYYKDEIIKIAEKALEDPKILKQFKRKNFFETYTTWHDGNMADSIGERVFLGIFTLGISEISWTFFARLNDIIENHDNKKNLDEVLKCMKDIIDERN